MCKRLGFIFLTDEVKVLINDLNDLLQDFGFDYTFFMRKFSNLLASVFSNFLSDKKLNYDDEIKDVIEYSLSYQNKVKKIKPKLEHKAIESLRSLAKENPMMLYGIGVDPKFVEFQGKLSDNYISFIEKNPSKEKYEENKQRRLKDFYEIWRKLTLQEIECVKNFDKSKIEVLLSSNHVEYIYKFPLNEGVCKNTLLKQYNQEKGFLEKFDNDEIEKIINFKLNTLNSFNPVYALRRHVIQNAIYDAEKNNYEKIKFLSQVFSEPFNNNVNNTIENFDFTNPPNLNECNEVCLSCSS
jgi:uncharacterized protein YdiU (UPF0061 family)